MLSHQFICKIFFFKYNLCSKFIGIAHVEELNFFFPLELCSILVALGLNPLTYQVF